MTLARTLMVQGTASSVGKSLLVTALCRYFRQQGVSVAPFKALNMALNAHVTEDGLEIARAQAVQAAACGIAPSVAMNPLLLKPESNQRSQVILLGKPSGSRSARELFATGLDVKGAVVEALDSLRAKHDLVILEGAGSPAEINLRARDVANMFAARAADAPVLLAGDIDRGGVFAAFVGTLELLEPEERARVRGFLVNKFRGDLGLLTPGLDWLRERTGIPVAGVLPHLGKLRLAEEDSLDVDARSRQPVPAQSQLSVVVLRLPRISNHDEFQPLEHEQGVALSFSDDPALALAADLLVVPGTKSTVSDLAWLRAQGLHHVVALRAQRGLPVLGICGGCQMLGERIVDRDRVESSEPETVGLGLLPLTTHFQSDKNTQRVRARAAGESWLFAGLGPEIEVPGYFIHAGLTRTEGRPAHEFADARGRWASTGAISDDGSVIGSMVHGLLEHDGLRHALLDELRRRRGLGAASEHARWDREAEYDRLADAIRESCDTALLDRLALGRASDG